MRRAASQPPLPSRLCLPLPPQLPAACLSRKCEFNTNFEGKFLKLLCRQFTYVCKHLQTAPPRCAWCWKICLVCFFSHFLAFFKWLYWSFNQMYHQIYYTGRSVTDRTTIDEAPDHPLMTQKPSVFFLLKVRKLVRPPQCHLNIKYDFFSLHIFNTLILLDFFSISFFFIASGLI